MWNAYLNRAWQAARKVGDPSCLEKEIEATRPENRITNKYDDAIFLVLYSAFILESRLYQIWRHDPGEQKPDGLEELKKYILSIGEFSTALKNYDPHVLRWFDELRDLRNAIAHGDLSKIRKLLGDDDRCTIKAHKYYNFVIDIIAVLNTAWGYWPKNYDGPREFTKQPCQKLKLKEPSGK